MLDEWHQWDISSCAKWDPRSGWTPQAARCSIGFSVVGGFVTTGHSGTPGAATTGYNGAAQGTFQATSFPGDDMAWVATNASWTPQPWVNQYNGYAAVVGDSTAAPPGSAYGLALVTG
jgi:streptogrisin C